MATYFSTKNIMATASMDEPIAHFAKGTRAFSSVANARLHPRTTNNIKAPMPHEVDQLAGFLVDELMPEGLKSLKSALRRGGIYVLGDELGDQILKLV
ncbi:hypothetical protein E6O75_ATG03277 [Venturia nashicola]|uniref:Uncharacterized protein n=1 Tax=Venturia nashicola TaxID=86259 RepID=A0A4Z1PEQ2_9PEZI|nr:hypothetical protein E6O75_ATG03277 [Venturia nashicola]